MFLSSRFTHSVLMVSHLDENKIIKTDVICDYEGISRQFMDQLGRSLRVAGIITAKKGPNGGYKLARPLEEITYYDVFKALNESMYISMPRTHRKEESYLSIENKLNGLRDKVLKKMQTMTITRSLIKGEKNASEN